MFIASIEVVPEGQNTPVHGVYEFEREDGPALSDGSRLETRRRRRQLLPGSRALQPRNEADN